jgi:hypothetical protein
MDELLSYLLRPGVLTIAMVSYIATMLLRRVVETARPDLKKLAGEMDNAKMYGSRAAVWWNEVILYALPVLIAGTLGLLPSDFLHGPIPSTEARVMFSCGVGWFSGMIYKALRKGLGGKLSASAGSEPPGPPST